MNRRDVLTCLRTHREELARFGVLSLSLFGSVARDEGGPESDVDLLVEFDGPPTFDVYIDTKFYLEDLLGAHVDLVTIGGLKPRVRPYIERDLIRVA